MSEPVLTAMQRVKLIITGIPFGEPHFKHEGEDVIRWLTGGIMPDAWVTFHHLGDGRIEVRCANCQTVVGYLPSDWEKEETVRVIGEIRLSGHTHEPKEGYPPRSQLV